MKKVLAMTAALIMAIAAVPGVSAQTTSAPIRVEDEVVAMKYGDASEVQSTITISEDASGDITVPLDFLNKFSDKSWFPGDTVTYSFKIVNNSKYQYDYEAQSFTVSLDGDMNLPLCNYFYSTLFSVSFLRTLNMSSRLDTDCGFANYLDKSSERYHEVDVLLGNTLSIASGAVSDTRTIHIGLNGPLMGNEYASFDFDGKMQLVLKQKPAAPEQPTEKATISVTTPKRMSIRLEDGTILHNGDSFEMNADGEVRFQMCSNNWDKDIYDDNGNGLAGTVVYTVKVSDKYNGRSYDEASKTFVLPKGDLVLRTDVNKCFMAYRYHFTKGNYNKRTGIAHVVDSPLESLSVNLPLGSTIVSDAYIAQTKVDAANVFIETGSDKELSYTDYYWEH